MKYYQGPGAYPKMISYQDDKAKNQRHSLIMQAELNRDGGKVSSSLLRDFVQFFIKKIEFSLLEWIYLGGFKGIWVLITSPPILEEAALHPCLIRLILLCLEILWVLTWGSHLASKTQLFSWQCLRLTASQNRVR